jgi:phosphotransferase system HPr (HPr) family protein
MSDSDAVARRTVVVTDPIGVHLRTATNMAAVVGRSRSRVTVIKGDRQVPAADIFGVLTLDTPTGQSLTLEAVGQDAEAVLDALVPFFEGRFPEEANHRESRGA